MPTSLTGQDLIDSAAVAASVRDHLGPAMPGIGEHDMQWYAAFVSMAGTLLAEAVDTGAGKHSVPTSAIEGLTTTLQGLLNR